MMSDIRADFRSDIMESYLAETARRQIYEMRANALISKQRYFRELFASLLHHFTCNQPDFHLDVIRLQMIACGLDDQICEFMIEYARRVTTTDLLFKHAIDYIKKKQSKIDIELRLDSDDEESVLTVRILNDTFKRLRSKCICGIASEQVLRYEYDALIRNLLSDFDVGENAPQLMMPVFEILVDAAKIGVVKSDVACNAEGRYNSINDQPAITKPDGTQEWYCQGRLHRDGGRPARIGPGQMWWFVNGTSSRDPSVGPAIDIDLPEIRQIEWMVDGQLIDRVETGDSERYKVFKLVTNSESVHFWRRFRTLGVDDDEIREILAGDSDEIAHLRKRWTLQIIADKKAERERITQQMDDELAGLTSQLSQLKVGGFEKRSGSEDECASVKRIRI
jgi:DNA-binding transcriptional MerR regulator